MKKLLSSLLILATALVPIAVLADYTITTTTLTEEITGFGRAGAGDFQQVADVFTTIGAGTVSSIEIGVKIDAGSPADDVVIAVQADSAGVPSGIDLATGSIAAASITGTCAAYSVTLAAPVALDAATTYFGVLRRSGALSDTAYYRSCGDEGPVSQLYYNGTTWATSGSGGSNDGIIHFVMTVAEGGGVTVSSILASILEWFEL